MSNVGDYIVKAGHGVCRVDAVTYLKLSDSAEKRAYYVISPIEQDGIKLYIPEDKIDELTRSVMSGEQAWDLIEHINEIAPAEIADAKNCGKRCKDAIKNNDPRELVSVIKKMYERKKKRAFAGKDETETDRRFFKLLEDILYSELAFAIGRNKSEIVSIIKSIAVNKMT